MGWDRDKAAMRRKHLDTRSLTGMHLRAQVHASCRSVAPKVAHSCIRYPTSAPVFSMGSRRLWHATRLEKARRDVVRNAIDAVQVFQIAGVLWKLPLGDDLASDPAHLADALVGAAPLVKVKSRVEVVIHLAFKSGSGV
jgi:hypothetical protein